MSSLAESVALSKQAAEHVAQIEQLQSDLSAKSHECAQAQSKLLTFVDLIKTARADLEDKDRTIAQLRTGIRDSLLS
jgi:chromosome segregation ATPase